MSDQVPASPTAPPDPSPGPARQPIHIVSIHAENVKRLKCVDIAPGDGVGAITIGGKNGAGKSSVLDAIQMALAGGKSIPPEPINTDAVTAGRASGDPAKMTIVAALSNGLVVKRTRRDGGKDFLEITNADGGSYRSPQAILDAMIGDLCFDPLAFILMPPRDKRATLMKIARLDFAQGDRDKATIREALRDSEATAKATAAALASMGPAIPAIMRLPVDQLVADVAVADQAVRNAQALRATLDRCHDAMRAADRTCEAARKRVDEIEAMLARAKEELAKASDQSVAAGKAYAEQKAIVIAMGDESATAADLRKQLSDAQDQNRRADAADRDADRRRTLLTQQADAAATIDELKKSIKAIEEERVTMLAEATYPVDGLGLSDDGVVYNGRPLEQASQAEQLRVSVAMGLSMNPTLRVMLIRQGALLDTDHLALLSTMAEEAGAQVWVERVGDDGTCAVVMEDGGVLIDRMNG